MEVSCGSFTGHGTLVEVVMFSIGMWVIVPDLLWDSGA